MSGILFRKLIRPQERIVRYLTRVKSTYISHNFRYPRSKIEPSVVFRKCLSIFISLPILILSAIPTNFIESVAKKHSSNTTWVVSAKLCEGIIRLFVRCIFQVLRRSKVLPIGCGSIYEYAVKTPTETERIPTLYTFDYTRLTGIKKHRLSTYIDCRTVKLLLCFVCDRWMSIPYIE